MVSYYVVKHINYILSYLYYFLQNNIIDYILLRLLIAVNPTASSLIGKPIIICYLPSKWSDVIFGLLIWHSFEKSKQLEFFIALNISEKATNRFNRAFETTSTHTISHNTPSSTMWWQGYLTGIGQSENAQ